MSHLLIVKKICIRSSAVHSPTTQQSAFKESSQSSTLQWLRRAVCSRLRSLKWRLLSSVPPTHAAAHRAGKLLSIVQLCCCVGSKSDRKDGIFISSRGLSRLLSHLGPLLLSAGGACSKLVPSSLMRSLCATPLLPSGSMTEHRLNPHPGQP